ncbi:hypothetical protein D6D17_07469 [Aureobasidium pullulans]|nr:hypothetical protein D6D17_07469 [Aureobasidium pullulans]
MASLLFSRLWPAMSRLLYKYKNVHISKTRCTSCSLNISFSKSQVIVPVCMTIVSCVGLSSGNDSLRGLSHISVSSSVKRLPPLN